MGRRRSLVAKHFLCNLGLFRNLRKLLGCVVTLVLSIVILSACGGSYVQGLEYCNDYVNDTVEIQYLLYDREFIDKYSYKEGNFHYYGGTFTICKSLLYLEYDEETYMQAKEDILSNTECSDFYFNYKGFKLYQNISWMKEQRIEDHWHLESLSTTFVMLGYNDINNTIVLIGYSNSDSWNDIYGEDIKNDTDFSEFIERYYLEFYDFE
jgi:hypothetical protein